MTDGTCRLFDSQAEGFSYTLGKLPKVQHISPSAITILFDKGAGGYYKGRPPNEKKRRRRLVLSSWGRQATDIR